MLLSRGLLRSLFRFDGVITIASGLLMIAFPKLLTDILAIGVPTNTVMLLGIVWLLFGLWLAYIWKSDYSKPMALFNAVFLALNADLLIFGPLFANYEMSTFGWLAFGATAAFIFFIALQWFLLFRRMDSDDLIGLLPQAS